MTIRMVFVCDACKGTESCACLPAGWREVLFAIVKPTGTVYVIRHACSAPCVRTLKARRTPWEYPALWPAVAVTSLMSSAKRAILSFHPVLRLAPCAAFAARLASV